MKTLFKNALVYLEGEFVNTPVLVENGKISSLSEPCCSFENIELINLESLYLLPGFIDIHTHGGFGVDVNNASVDGFEILSKFFASKGTTSYLASVLTDSRQKTLKILESVSEAMRSGITGANLLGAHLEGPFLSKEKKGAMPEEYLKPANKELFDEYFQSGVVKYITIAPETEGALDLIKAISPSLSVALGHSNANFSTAMKAIELGANASTHTFNAMRQLDRVEPGILGAVMASGIFNEIIADGRHVHPENVKMLYKLKGNKKLVAITDSIEAAGMPDGEYKLGINDVVLKGSDAFLKGTSSRAGSVLTMDNALKNLMAFLDISLEEAIPMLTQNPADLLGLNKGYIRIGYDADFTVLDKELNVVGTVIGGRANIKL